MQRRCRECSIRREDEACLLLGYHAQYYVEESSHGAEPITPDCGSIGPCAGKSCGNRERPISYCHAAACISASKSASNEASQESGAGIMPLVSTLLFCMKTLREQSLLEMPRALSQKLGHLLMISETSRTDGFSSDDGNVSKIVFRIPPVMLPATEYLLAYEIMYLGKLHRHFEANGNIYNVITCVCVSLVILRNSTDWLAAIAALHRKSKPSRRTIHPPSDNDENCASVCNMLHSETRQNRLFRGS